MLLAYAIGLVPVLLIRSVVASFFARGDTATPVIASLIALACNVVMKVMLSGHLGAAGLALATAIGAWINLGILYGLAIAKGWTRPDDNLAKAVIEAFAGAVAFEWVAFGFRQPALNLAMALPTERILAATVMIGGAALAAYAAVAAVLWSWLGLPKLRRPSRPRR